ncbi:MAG: hypothetical protein DSY53_01395, partial [Persephonella sp.]
KKHSLEKQRVLFQENDLQYKKGDNEYIKLIEELNKIDIATLTPLEALLKLNELKGKAKNLLKGIH